MVNFGNQIRNHAVGRWVSHYVQYRELKVSILKTVEQLSADGTPGSPAVEPGRRVGSSTVSTPLLTYPASNALIDKLMDELSNEIVRVSDFFSSTLQTLQQEVGLAYDLAQPTMTMLGTPPASPRSRSVESKDLGSIPRIASHPMLSNVGVHDLPSPQARSSTPTCEHMGGLSLIRVSTSTPEVSASTSKPQPKRGLPDISDQDVRTREGYRLWLMDLHRTASELQNFQILNHTGFVKLCKKLVPPTFSGGFVSKARDFLGASSLATDTCLPGLVSELEGLYAALFADGDLQLAKVELLVGKSKQLDWELLALGLRCGVAVMMVIWCVWDVVIDGALRPVSPENESLLTHAVPVYRGIGCLLFIPWLWGCDVQVWRTLRINYLYVLDCDTRLTQSPRKVFGHAAMLTILFCVNFLLFFKALRRQSIPWLSPHYYPLILFLTFLACAVFPWDQRKGVWTTIGRVLVAPLTPVTFRESFMADILTSLTKVTSDLTYTFCYFFTGQWKDVGVESCSARWEMTHVIAPLFYSIPMWVRLMQNIRRYRDTRQRWPHLANAFKYALAQSVVLFSYGNPSLSKAGNGPGLRPVQIVWVVMFVTSTLYTFTWDVTMDWGLAKPGSAGLRPSLLLKKRWLYWAAIVIDFVLRFVWTYQLIPPAFLPFWADSASSLYNYMVVTTVACVELCRRFMWAVLRVEFEHLNNAYSKRTDGGMVPIFFDLTKRSIVRSRSDWQPAQTGKRVILEAIVFVVVVVVVSVFALASL